MSYLVSHPQSKRSAGGKSMADMFGGRAHAAGPGAPRATHVDGVANPGSSHLTALWRCAGQPRKRVAPRV